MAIIWGLPNWVWLVVAGIAFATCLVIVRVLATLFAGFRDLFDSLQLTKQMLDASLESTRQELTVVQERMARLGARGEDGGAEEVTDSWRNW